MTSDEKNYLELFPPEKQKEWGWPAIANFTLGGAGAGFHCLNFLADLLGNNAIIYSNASLLKLLGPIMVAIGFMFLPIEAGRPSRSFHLISQIKHSWISREIAFFLIFLLAALGDYFSPSVALRLLSVAGAVGLIISQGFIVYDSKAVTAWNRPAVPWLFLSSGIASGTGVALLLSSIGLNPLSPIFILIAIVSITANAIMWVLYLYSSGQDDKAFRSVTQPLRRLISLMAILGIGHFLPLFLILFLFPENAGVIGKPSFHLTIISAVLIILGVSTQKLAIIHIVGDKRSIGFNMQRNSD